MAYNNFYAQHFSRRQPRCMTPEEIRQSETDYLIDLAQSPLAEHCKERFEVPQITEAEDVFNTLLKEIKDPELRNKIDMAAGNISRAYEILGFCAGHFSTDSRAMNF